MSTKLTGWKRSIIARPWLRIGLAVMLLVAGLAPVGVPILSDSSWRVLPGPAGAPVGAQPFLYKWHEANGLTDVQRSDDGGQTWHQVATIPQTIAQLEAVRGNEQQVLARSRSAIWSSSDGGASWRKAATLPSRPLSMAVSHATSGLLFVGTESVGLLRSNDSGDTWLPVESDTLSAAGLAPTSVTALAINPEDDQIIYAATGIWLGSSHAHFAPLGTFISVDGGRKWFELARAQLDTPAVQRLTPIPGQPLAVSAADTLGERTITLQATPQLLASLGETDAAARAAAARTLGLLGDPSLLPDLLRRLDDPDPDSGHQLDVDAAIRGVCHRASLAGTAPGGAAGTRSGQKLIVVIGRIR